MSKLSRCTGGNSCDGRCQRSSDERVWSGVEVVQVTMRSYWGKGRLLAIFPSRFFSESVTDSTTTDGRSGSWQLQ